MFCLDFLMGLTAQADGSYYVQSFSFNFGVFCSAVFTTKATEFTVISFFLQKSLSSQSSRILDPLLALHEMQQRAILSIPFILISLTICSHEGLLVLELSLFENSIPQ